MGDMLITWSPSGVALPEKLGLFCYQNATGIPGITALTISATTHDQGYDLENCPDLITLSLASLVSLTDAGTLFLLNCAALTTVVLTSLQTTADGGLFIQSNPSLTGLALPALVSNGGAWTIRDNAAMSSFTPSSSWLPGNFNLAFSGNAWDQASVDLVLARCVANAAVTSAIINLDGGTMAAPSVAGLADAATLTGRGCVVTTN